MEEKVLKHWLLSVFNWRPAAATFAQLNSGRHGLRFAPMTG